MILIFASSNCN